MAGERLQGRVCAVAGDLAGATFQSLVASDTGRGSVGAVGVDLDPPMGAPGSTGGTTSATASRTDSMSTISVPPPTTQTDQRWVVPSIISATIASVFPGFLIGALAVQASADFGVTESTYGWGLGGFFLAATIGSIGLGRLAQRIGPRRQILTGLVITLGVELFIAAIAPGWWWVVGALAIAGFMNAGTQTAVNLALTQARLPRLGLAIALKQSAMPAASMLGGLAVPALALTLGWRWAYGVGALITLGAITAVALNLPAAGHHRVSQSSTAGQSSIAEPGLRISSTVTTGSTRSDLVVAAMAGACLSFAAGALNAWVVSSGVNAGLGEATAGLMLSLGAVLGITLRVIVGTRLDEMSAPPFLVAGLMVLIGAAGIALLAVGTPRVHMMATLIAFAGGWVWPVFTNFGIVRANAATAARATGITQTGVYIGVFSAPLTTGWLIHHFGYSRMWLAVAAVMVVGSALAISLRNRF